MTDKPGETDPLEGFFEAGRANPAEPGDALMARVLADADATQNSARVVARPAKRVRPAIWAVLTGAVGGWPAMAGFVTATMAGVWIGVSAPPALSSVAQNVLDGSAGNYVVDFDEADTFEIAEGGL